MRVKAPETVEESIQRLKASYQYYAAEAEKARAEVEVCTARYVRFSDAATQMQDAINALEGRPTMEKMLKEALAQQKPVTDPRVVTKPAILGAPYGNPNPDLPPPEPGMKWAKNELQEDILIPVDGYKEFVEDGLARTTRIALPAIGETWEEPTLDL